MITRPGLPQRSGHFLRHRGNMRTRPESTLMFMDALASVCIVMTDGFLDDSLATTITIHGEAL
jgi:hypothetical protein